MLADFLTLLGMFAAFTIICFVADAIGLSLLEQDNEE